MRKWITFLMTLLVGSTSYANAIGDVNLFAGYRHDNIDLKHRSPSRDPNLKEHTRFKNIDIFQIGINARTTLGCNFYGRAEASGGWVLDGELRQRASSSVYAHNALDSSGSPFSLWEEKRHETTFDERYVYDANIAIGYPFYFCNCSAIVAPVIGYAVNAQDMSSYNREIGIDRSGFGCDKHLESGTGSCRHTYFNRWYGPFVGADFAYRPFNECFSLYAAFEYHWGTFKAKRSNSDTDQFDNHNRHEDMYGWVFDLGADYEFSGCWTVGLYLKFTNLTASKHRRNDDNSDSSDSGDHRKVKNSAFWNSYAVNVEIGRKF